MCGSSLNPFKKVKQATTDPLGSIEGDIATATSKEKLKQFGSAIDPVTGLTGLLLTNDPLFGTGIFKKSASKGRGMPGIDEATDEAKRKLLLRRRRQISAGRTGTIKAGLLSGLDDSGRKTLLGA